MSGGFQPNLDFAAAGAAAEDGEALIVDIDGYEGPLHVLLALARSQKVDLLKLSVLKLAEQYLAFVQEIATRLAFRLAKLDAMRNAAEELRTRAQLGRDVFVRGDPEAIKVIPSGRIEGDLYTLMSAYIGQRTKEASRTYTPRAPTAYPLEDARERLRRLLPDLDRWTPLAGVAPFGPEGHGPSRASYVASTLSASLELVKEGALEARQLEAFADIYLRSKSRPDL